MTYKPGVYFSMPFDEYVKVPAMNASRLKLELVSPMDSWARSSLNPVFAEIDDETKAKNEGRIYHKLILEGQSEFDKVYAPALEDDPNDKTILRTSDDIKYALAKCGAPVTFKTKDEGITRLLDADPKARIWAVMDRDHRAKFPGREFVPAQFLREVQLHNHVIKYNPELRSWLAGGYPEGTGIWDDQELGMRFKIRIDYLKVKFPVDLKSFANSKMKRVKLAIADAIAAQKYHIQGSLYMRGVGAAKFLVENGMVFNIIEPAMLTWQWANDEDLEKWLQEFTRYPAESFNFIFIQKGPAPVAVGNWMKKDGAMDRHGRILIEEAVNSHLKARRTFGDDPPLNLEPAQELQMDEMPAYINSI